METGEPKTNYYALRQESPHKKIISKKNPLKCRSNLTKGENKKIKNIDKCPLQESNL